MCPACLATISMIVAGAISTGGVTVLAAKAFGGKRGSKEANGQSGGGDESQETRPREKENEA